MTDRPQLRRLVTAELAGLDTDARALVDAASVLGEHVRPAALATMVDRTAGELADPLSAGLRVGVLHEAADGLRFEHALVREAVYRELSAAHRGQLHRRAAQALASLSGPPGSIATHWQRAGGSEATGECLRWAEIADADARTALAHDDAARFAALAVDCGRRTELPGEELARLLIRLAEALQLAGRVELSLDACTEAADLAEAAGRADLLAQAGLVVHGFGHPAVAQLVPPICRRALDMVPLGEHSTRARLLAQIAIGAAETDGGPPADELSGAALAEADRSGDPTAILEAVAARHLAISIPHTVAERLELGRRAIELSHATAQPMATLWGHLWRAFAAIQLGNIAAFDLEVTEVDRVARLRRSVLARWHHHRLVAQRASMTGEFDIARAANNAARELGMRSGDISLIVTSYAFSSVLSFVRGDAGEMPADWEAALRQAPKMPLVRIALPMQHAVQGDLDRARAEFEPFRHLPRAYPLGVRWSGTLTMVGLLAVLLDDAEVAAAMHDAFADLGRYCSGDGSGSVYNFGATAGMLGDFARVAGRPRDALANYRESVDLNVRVGARPATALNRLGWAQALAALDLAVDPESGRSAVDLAT